MKNAIVSCAPAPEDAAIRFLRLILPEKGHYIVATKKVKGGFKPSIFASTIEELATIIENQDRDGLEVYHACASFRENTNDPPGTPEAKKRYGRTGHNALGAKAFWLDLDVGQDKPYKSQNEAMDALATFCQTLKLPPPIIVSSGWGLHVYWPLREMLDPTTWKQYAGRLKRLCEMHGLHADPPRTADIASVLRTPGTHNRKGGKNIPVECDPVYLGIVPYDIAQFAVFLEAAPAAPEGPEPSSKGSKGSATIHHLPPRRGVGLSSRPRRPRPDLMEKLKGLDEYPPAYAAEIVGKCGQLQELRDKKGNIPNGAWYNCLGVMAHCEDGYTLAHEWSSGYANERFSYSFDETQRNLDRQRGFGPTTCEKFHGDNPGPCVACPLRGTIKSPIKLGEAVQLIPKQDEPVAAGAMLVEAPTEWKKTEKGYLLPNNLHNTLVALGRIGLTFRHDVFHDRLVIEGDTSGQMTPELSDACVHMLWLLVNNKVRYDTTLAHVRDAAEMLCHITKFDPIRDYLDGLQWDGRARLDRWLITYLGADDTLLNRSIGRKVLIAAVRRVRQPGCKFDFVAVLEGKQGTGKSTTLRILAGPDNFSDQPLLHLDTRAQQEALEGIWIYEISELAGLRRTETETVKGFLSKTTDDARPAYGRFRIDQPRRCIFIGTTNDSEYLRDATGNRRFWPIKTGKIDLVAVQRDRDQLWAEAAAVEAQGEDLVFAADLYEAATDQQEQRRMKDGWEDLLAGVPGKSVNVDGTNVEERISSNELLTMHLRLPADKITDVATKRLAAVMNRLGWQGPKKIKFDVEGGIQAAGKQIKRTVALQGYWRPVLPA